jgi:flagellin
MSSILNNSAALSALQALTMTQQSLAIVQGQVSTGLKVGTAADNSSYWSIAAQLRSDSGVVTASNDALSEGQSVLATASSAIDSVIKTLNSMTTSLTQAQNPGANIGDINTSLASLGRQLSDSVKGASFNGLNVLNGTQSTLSFVSGFNATSTGGTLNIIAFAAQALTGGATTTPTTTTTQSSVTDTATITNLAGLFNAPPTNATLSYGNDVITASTTGPMTLTVQSKDLNGSTTTTTYTALDANGNNSAIDTSLTSFANAASLAVSTTTTTAASSNLLTQSGVDLTGGSGPTSTFQLGGTTGIAASLGLTAVNQALAAVTNYAALIGATQDRMTAATTFNTALTTNYSNGVSGLVDADMNQASTRLLALQTQQQLGIQSLSVANQNAQLILKLFP